ncbi:MAG: SDR family NAD(P)-dependent oxidoreductase [Bacteriovoracaceae bacterium]
MYFPIFGLIKAFLPAMIKNGGGQVCEIASRLLDWAFLGLVTYATSKHAVIGFVKSLQAEISELHPGKIHFTTVCPSFINTGLFANVTAPRLTPILDQAKIAKIIFDSIETKKDFVMEPFLVKTIPLLSAVLPPKLFNSVTKIFKLHNSMDKILEKKSDH